MGVYEKRHILGQVAPSATTETVVYTCTHVSFAPNTDAMVSTVLVCNRGATATTFRIAAVINGGAASDEDWICYDTPIEGNETFFAQMGLAMNEDDEIRIYAGNANLSFSVFGVEIDGSV